MYRRLHLSLLACLLCGLGGAVSEAQAQPSPIAVIAHGDAADGLSFVELQRLYAGEVTTYGPLAIQQDLSERFFQSLLGKSDDAVRRLWVRLLLSGKVSQGLVGFRTDAAVVEFVRDTPGALGFVDAARLEDERAASGISVVPLDGILPGAHGYPLDR